MSRRTLVLSFAALAIAGLAAATSLSAQTCRVCVSDASWDRQPVGASGSAGRTPAGGTSPELDALIESLGVLGIDYVVTTDPAAETCQVAMSLPSCQSCDSTPDLAWVQAGHGYVQISDWGRDFQANSWADIAEAQAVQIDVVDAGHPITQGLPASWTTRGFWSYDPGGDYIGWVTDPDPNLASVDGNVRGLSARTEGSGRLVYVGWNVYGSYATSEDLAVLGNSIAWAGQCGATATADWVEVPTLSRGALAALAALLAAAAIFVLKR